MNDATHCNKLNKPSHEFHTSIKALEHGANTQFTCLATSSHYLSPQIEHPPTTHEQKPPSYALLRSVKASNLSSSTTTIAMSPANLPIPVFYRPPIEESEVPEIDWASNVYLKHHCGVCKTPLNQPGFQCLGTHQFPCANFHLSLFRSKREISQQHCDPCRQMNEAIFQRCKSIAVIIRDWHSHERGEEPVSTIRGRENTVTKFSINKSVRKGKNLLKQTVARASIPEHEIKQVESILTWAALKASTTRPPEPFDPLVQQKNSDFLSSHYNEHQSHDSIRVASQTFAMLKIVLNTKSSKPMQGLLRGIIEKINDTTEALYNSEFERIARRKGWFSILPKRIRKHLEEEPTIEDDPRDGDHPVPEDQDGNDAINDGLNFHQNVHARGRRPHDQRRMRR